MANFKNDLSGSRASAEKLAPLILNSLRGQDPMVSLCALSLISSHLMTMMATDGAAETYNRVLPDTRAKLLEQVASICQEAQGSSLN